MTTPAASPTNRTVLVTGATGTLGRALLPRLAADGHDVRALSRREQPPADGVTWVAGDLATGVGLAKAVAEVDVVVHAASDAKPRGSRDAETTRRLLDVAMASGARPHVVYISIVGVDGHPFGYYRVKHETEGVIEASGLPFTVQRTTQWHQLLDKAFSALVKSPLMVVPSRTAVQPLEVTEVADRLTELAGEPAAGRVEDMGGPEEIDLRDLARTYARAAGRRRAVAAVRLPGATARAFREGTHLASDNHDGTVTWDEFLNNRFA